MVDSKENYKFNLRIKELNSCVLGPVNDHGKDHLSINKFTMSNKDAWVD